MKIRNRVFLIILLPCMLIILSLIFYIMTTFVNFARNQARKDLLNESMRQAGIIKAQLDHDMDVTRNLAHLVQNFVPSLPRAMRRQYAFDMTRELLRNNPQITSLYITAELNLFDGLGAFHKNTRLGSDAGRYAIGLYWNKKRIDFENGTLTEKNITNSDWYKAPKKNRTESILEPYLYTYTGRKKDNILMTSLLVPYFNRNRVFAGAVGADISLNTIQKKIARIRSYNTGYAVLLSQSGKQLSLPGNGKPDRPLFRHPLEWNTIRRRTGNGKWYTDFSFSESSGKMTLRCFVPLKIGNAAETWVFGILVPVNEVFSIINRMLLLTMLIILATTGLLIWLIILFVKKIITKPIECLADAANAIRNGNYEFDTGEFLNIRAKEIRILVDSFRKMAVSLQEKEIIVRKIADGAAEIDFDNLDEDLTVERNNDTLGLVVSSINKMKDRLSQGYSRIKITEQELRHSRSIIKNIIDSMPSTIIAVDKEGRITQWNLQAIARTGIKTEDAIGMKLSLLLPDNSLEVESVEACIAGRKEFHFLTKSELPDQMVRHEEVTIFPLITDEFTGAVLQISDVSKQHRLQEQLNQTRKMEALGLLTGGIAHDFNNMLTGIMGAAELLAQPSRNLDEKSIEFVDIIRKASFGAAELIMKLMAFSRKGEIEFKTQDLEKIIDDTMDILARTIDRRISIKTVKNAESHFIYGNKAALQNSLLNLGINASHAMSNGGSFTVETSNVRLDEEYCRNSPFDLSPGTFIRIELRDTGCGIPQENLARIFEPFFTTKEQGKGNGLGLAAVYGTIQDHEGAIHVYSEVGTGTSFLILLPCSDPEMARTSEITAPYHGSGTVLLVDDEEMIRITATEQLHSMGFRVITAGNGEEALEIYSEQHSEIDLVIMDMIMPRMHGSEAFLAMKEIDPDCRAILASGFSKKEKVKELKKQGLNGFIHKPYHRDELGQLIKKVLDDKD